MDSSSGGDTEEKRPMFGNRVLTSNANVFQHNAWDNVEWTEAQEEEAHKTTLAQLEKSMPPEEQTKFLSEPSTFWDKFYSQGKLGVEMEIWMIAVFCQENLLDRG